MRGMEYEEEEGGIPMHEQDDDDMFSNEYQDYRDIVIEINDKILKFMTSFKVGSILSLEVLVDLADKFECDHCEAVFYSKSLDDEHKKTHHSPRPVSNISTEIGKEEKFQVQNSFQNKMDQNDGVSCDIKIVNEKEKYSPNSFQIKVGKDDETDFDEEDEQSIKIETDQIEYSDKDEHSITEEPNDMTQKEGIEQTLPYKCSLCDKAFVKQSWLVKHGFSHTKLNQEEYSCFHCDNFYGGRFAKQSYRKHIDRLIMKDRRICDACDHEARSVKDLELHKQVKHLGLKQFKCEIDGCGKEFSKNYYLRRHKRTHNSISEYYTCDQCDWSGNSRNNLSRHIQRRHIDLQTLNLNCEECNYIGKSKESLKNHYQKYHSGIINECSLCDKKYAERQKYLLHLRRDHEGIRYKCENCDQEYTDKYILNSHIKREHEGLVIKCEKCEHKATSQRALRKHFIRIHQKNPYACEVCAFVGCDFSRISSHMNKMHNGVKYQCDLCEHVSYTQYFLKQHMKDLHPDQEANVYEHQQTAFNLEEFHKCEPCDSLFRTKDRYLIHVKKHDKPRNQNSKKCERTKTCQTCANVFTLSSYYRHIRNVHPVAVTKGVELIK